MKYRFFTLLCIVFYSFNTLHAERFLYVDDFKNILDNPARRTALLAYAQSRQINELIFYELQLVHKVHNLTNAATNQILADFIKLAKTTYGISKISAAGESAGWFQSNIMPYNASRSLASEKFDALHLEFEFWTPSAVSMYYCPDYLIPNSLPCDSAGAFVFCKNQLTQMKTMTAASSHPMLVEMYVGHINSGQLQTLSAIADRIFIHAYVANPSTSFNYVSTRLNFYNNYNGTAKVYFIFSSEPSFMQSWLLAHSMTEAESIFTTSYNAASGLWKSHVNFSGFVYFAYTFQTNIIIPIHWIKTAGKRIGKTVQLDWTITNTEGLENFDLERSTDGKEWTHIATLNKNDRQFVDNEPIAKPLYYRLQARLYSKAEMETSPIVSVASELGGEVLKISPNPFKDVIQLPDFPVENVYLVNSQGQKQRIEWDNSDKITGLKALPDGFYVLWVLAYGEWRQIKMVKNEGF
jgi:hypothetical protein